MTDDMTAVNYHEVECCAGCEWLRPFVNGRYSVCVNSANKSFRYSITVWGKCDLFEMKEIGGLDG